LRPLGSKNDQKSTKDDQIRKMVLFKKCAKMSKNDLKSAGFDHIKSVQFYSEKPTIFTLGFELFLTNQRVTFKIILLQIVLLINRFLSKIVLFKNEIVLFTG
jgi:hypothetical protein